MLPYLETLRLVDHHCHGVVRRDLDRPGLESLLSEADRTDFDSQIGFAVRRWCAPVLDLPPHTTPDEYVLRRVELGATEVTRRFLAAAGLAALCVDTGYTPEPLLSPAELAVAADADAREVVRLESVAERIAGSGGTAEGFADAVRRELAAGGVAAKTIAAYRVGLDLSGDRPTDAEVTAAAGRLQRDASPRVRDPILHRFLIWAAIDQGLPVQIHVGYGDRDVDLHRCNPLLLTGLLRALEPTGVPILLLHNYPYHREAGYLAQVFRTVFIDVGLATHNLGQRSAALVAEALELTPFGKLLYASDAYGLAEHYYLGALLFRRALSEFLSAGLADGAWTDTDAARIAELIGAGNARRVYGLP